MNATLCEKYKQKHRIRASLICILEREIFMFIQAFALLTYLVFGVLVLSFWAAYKVSIRNLVVFVFFGGVGFMLAAVVVGTLVSNKIGTIESRMLVIIFLCSAAASLLGGSYLGLKYFGSKNSSGTGAQQK